MLSGSFWHSLVHNIRFVIVIIVAFTLMGLFTIATIPKEANPEVIIPIGFVSTGFPGASPIDTEELITTPIENKVLSLDKVSKVTSTSSRGFSSIVIEFDAQSDTAERMDKLKDKVDEIKNELPEDATDPIVKQVSFSDRPIFTFAISGDYSLGELQEYAERFQDEIERINGVSDVNINGGQTTEFHVIVDKAKLDNAGVSINQVTSSISSANSDIPAGTIETGEENFSIRFEGRLQDKTEIENIPLLAKNDSVILIRDIANVIKTTKEKTSISRLSTENNKPLPAISIGVLKVDGANIINVVDSIFETIENAKNDYLPKGITIEIIEDSAQRIKDDLNTLLSNGIQTVIIIIIILFFFVGWREALLAGIAIPLSFLITFTVLPFAGSTLNFLTLFSLILSLGILVDGAIVITEGMHNHIKNGKTPTDAAIATIDEFKLPLISGTLTTVFAFVPMLLTSGIIGQFIKSIPITVTIVLLSSLFVALGVITTLGSKWLKNSPDSEEKNENKLIHRIQRKYSNTLAYFIEHKWKRRGLFTGITVLFLLSLMLPATGILEVNMFPSADEDTFSMSFEMPTGTTIEKTDSEIQLLETELIKDPRIISFITTVGGSSIQNSNTGQINIKLLEKDNRNETSLEIIDEYSQKFLNISNGKVSLNQQSSGPENSSPIEVRITGDNLETLEKISLDVKRQLTAISGARNVNSSLKESNGEFVLSIDRQKAELFGIKTVQIAGMLRNAITGSKATTIKKDGESIDVIVKYDLNPEEGKTRKTTIDIIGNLTIATPQGDIPLSNFLKKDISASQSGIEHLEGKRVVKITSDTKKGVTAQSIFTELEEKIKTIDLPKGYTISMGGEREDIEQSFNDMFRAMILAVFMIGGLLVWQFKSFRQPVFILITIPLALIGVFPGLSLINVPLSFPGIIGVVALAGIVVNNAIILIDKINENRYAGMEKSAAVLEAGKARLQPIILTTITTIMGILPLALGDPTWGPLGYSIVFGLLFSTVLTLIIIPLLYNQFGEKNI